MFQTVHETRGRSWSGGVKGDGLPSLNTILLKFCDLRMEERRTHLTPTLTWTFVSTSVYSLGETPGFLARRNLLIFLLYMHAIGAKCFYWHSGGETRRKKELGGPGQRWASPRSTVDPHLRGSCLDLPAPFPDRLGRRDKPYVGDARISSLNLSLESGSGRSKRKKMVILGKQLSRFKLAVPCRLPSAFPLSFPVKMYGVQFLVRL